MNESREGTLIEQDSDKVEVENVMKDLEKRLDLDSFVEVPAEISQKPTQETSAPTVEPSLGQTQENNLPTLGQIGQPQASEQLKVSEKPEISEERAPP